MISLAPFLAVLSLGLTPLHAFQITSCPALRHGRSSLSLPLDTEHAPILPRRQTDYMKACARKSRRCINSQLLGPSSRNVDGPKSGSLWTRFLLKAWRRIVTKTKMAQRTVAVLWMALAVLCSAASSADAIPSGGRMGGSFSSSPTISARSSRGSFRNGPLPPTGLYMRTNADAEVGELPGVLVQQPASPSGKAVKVVDPVTYYCALTGIYGLGVYRTNRPGKKKTEKESALGSGASVIKLTVALDVSDRHDDSCILSRLREISADAETSSRSGVQTLISEVALELLRQRYTVTAACSTYMHCSASTHAEIEFKRMSTFERAKFGKETVNIFNGVKAIEPADESIVDENSQATSAVVSMLVSIEGDRTYVPKIISRRDLENALLRIAADSQGEDCLLSAEVLWSPEDRSITLSNQDLVASYPELAVV